MVNIGQFIIYSSPKPRNLKLKTAILICLYNPGLKEIKVLLSRQRSSFGQRVVNMILSFILFGKKDK